MPFSKDILGANRPSSVRSVVLPRREPFRIVNNKKIPYYPSPVDWASQVLYFLMVDRFSDNSDQTRSLFNRADPPAKARPADFAWNRWAESGSGRWQGGNLRGVQSRLDYLNNLGITAIWLSPIFKQRHHSNEYHGYAVQDFLEVDPHFGTRQDLVDLIVAAHDLGIRVILDVIFNHSGHNWDYAGPQVDPPYRHWPEHYEKGPWLDADGNYYPSPLITGADTEAGVWPQELQRDECYTRAGKGNLSDDDIDNDHAVSKRTDFDGSFRDFNFDDSDTLSDLARCFKYWIALTDIDGMRLDTLKHVPKEVARNFCGTIREFAVNLGKADFFLVGEVAGPDANAGRYLDSLELNLNATLDIGESRTALTAVAKGLAPPIDYFNKIGWWDPILGSHRNSAHRHVKVIDDHDHVFGEKKRFSAGASNDHQVVAAVAIQLFTLGIPCIYYGTEQAFAGPEESECKWVPEYGSHDRYLRETMFGAEHPRRNGTESLLAGNAAIDANLPGFGAFGTAGVHFFDPDFHVFRRIKELIRIRQNYAPLRYGRQYLRPIRNSAHSFGDPERGEIIAWSRILDEEEMLCVVNSHGNESKRADIIVDSKLNAQPSFFTVIANTAELVSGNQYSGNHPVTERISVHFDGIRTYVEIKGILPSEVIVLTNRP